MTSQTIWFWQRMVTPHMAFLAVALAQRGHDVTYVAEQELAVERAALGWELPQLQGVKLCFATNAKDAAALVAGASAETIHLTQGLRSNGNVAAAQAAIRKRRQRHFVIMETVDQRGMAGWLKPAVYGWHLHRWRQGLNGILAIGAGTPPWLRKLAPPSLPIFPFAYFLPEHDLPSSTHANSCFRFLFVGSLIPLKRLDLLLQTLAGFSAYQFDIEVIGDGPMRDELETMAARLLPGKVLFRGVLPISEIHSHMVQADCLVLPSSHDGWGAVVSEALMAGTPVICSAACGSRSVVKASGTGGIFETFKAVALQELLEKALKQGPIGLDRRQSLSKWGRCLGANSGARYLETLISETPSPYESVVPPWEQST